jgi:hypothetical protein
MAMQKGKDRERQDQDRRDASGQEPVVKPGEKVGKWSDTEPDEDYIDAGGYPDERRDASGKSGTSENEKPTGKDSRGPDVTDDED